MSTGIPPIVLFVGARDASDGSYSQAMEEAGFWVARSASLGEALRDIVELRPDIVVADATGAPDTQPQEVVRALKGSSAARAVPVLLLDETVSAPALRTDIERTLATSRQERQRLDADAQSAVRACPECGRPLVWADRSRVAGVEYDYYRWCEAGCGLYCFELSTNNCLKLA